MALSDKELEKIKLMQQFKSGERTDLPDVDSDTYKLSKIKAMLDKETNEQESKPLNTVENLIINHLKGIYSNAYSDDFYQSFADQLMDNAKQGLVDLDGLDVQDEFDNFVSVNTDNIDETISLKEMLD